MWSIALFMAGTFILYLMIIKSRAKKIRQARLEEDYNRVIAKFLFAVVFEDLPYGEVAEDAEYQLLSGRKSFRKHLMASVMNLHQNYSGSYAQKLEIFYADTGLQKDSYKKLKSRKWEIRCSGVKELAEMNVAKAFDRLVKITKSRKKTLKITALHACIKINGIKGIVHLKAHKDPIDQWTKVNIIAALKSQEVEDTGIEDLLDSKNATVVALGLMVIESLKLTRKATFVEQLIQTAPDNLIRLEAQSVLQSLTT